ncbi:GspMb/PilO family protein [Methylobacterium nonmethylotrophicum]|nr:GspMb/PilO family protein [Methylobacterium nonmethylotrophicum]
MMRAVPESSFAVKTRRILSAVLAAGVVLSSIAAVANIISAYFERRDEIDRLRASVSALSSRARQSDRASPLVLPEVALGQVLAPTPDAGINHVQKVVRNLNDTLGVDDIQIDSVRLLPQLEEGSLTAGRASIAVTASHGQIFDIINIIESSTPAIMIDAVRINNRTASGQFRRGGAPGADAADSKARIKMTVTVRVYSKRLSDAVRQRNTMTGVAPSQAPHP